MNYSNSQRAGVILYLTTVLFGAYGEDKDILIKNEFIYRNIGINPLLFIRNKYT
jgi:hypothetical protein